MTQRLLLVSQLAALCAAPAAVVGAQQRDTTARPADSLRVYTLPPAVVSVTRANPPISKIPLAIHLVEKTEISRARPTWGLDEALATVPGVYAANRYNFSLDQRISIRGFGARSAFAVRGIKVLLDGIPQTLPDGQGQLTNLELGAADRIEVLRGSSSALFGNASGGVISIWTDPAAPRQDVPCGFRPRAGDAIATALRGAAPALRRRLSQPELTPAPAARARVVARRHGRRRVGSARR